MQEENSILFLGDVIPYKPFRFRNNLKTIINLECPVIRDGIPVSGKINLSVPQYYLQQTFGGQLMAVNLGNNHIMDYGVRGLESTLNELEKTGTEYFGVNLPGNDRHNPLIINYNGLRIALFSAISELTVPLVEFDDFIYLSLLDTEELIARINGIRNETDRIIIYIHWGNEESSFPLREDILTARSLVDAGADIIIGSHAHAPQPIEKYKDGIIAYNLGNFIAPAFRNMPSFYDESGTPLSEFSKKLMLWNRISWGISIDLKSMEYMVKKYVFIADRIIEIKTTPLDRFLELHPEALGDSYESIVKKHLDKRALRRKIRDFIGGPLKRIR